MGLFNFLKKLKTAPPLEKPQAKILVVDDEQVLKDFYEDLLTRQGYAVLTASDGQEAVSSSTQSIPDLIVLDIMMPGMDGFEVLKQLGANDRTKDIPVIVLTNAGSQENIERAKSYSVYKFFVKVDVSPEILLQTISEALQAKQPNIDKTSQNN